MTYQQAEEFKSKVEPEFIYQGLSMVTYITPANQADFDEYKTAWRSIKISDETAKMFCTNNDYIVRGICFMRDINMLWHIDLPL